MSEVTQKYFRYSLVKKELLADGELKLRLSVDKDTKSAFREFLDDTVKHAAQSAVKLLPISKKNNRPSRISFMTDDLDSQNIVFGRGEGKQPVTFQRLVQCSLPSAEKTARYARMVPIKHDLLKWEQYNLRYGGNDIPVTINDGRTSTKFTGTKNAFGRYFDCSLQWATQCIIDQMPRYSKGANKGRLSRITIHHDDIKEARKKCLP